MTEEYKFQPAAPLQGESVEEAAREYSSAFEQSGIAYCSFKAGAKWQSQNLEAIELIDKRILEIKIEKEEFFKEYVGLDNEMKTMVAALNMQMGMELETLTKIKTFLSIK